MNELGNNMNMFLEQVRQLNSQAVSGQIEKAKFLQQLKDLLGTYSDLKIEHYKGNIEDSYYTELVESLRDPEEKRLWERIIAAPQGTLPEVETKLSLVLQYIGSYPQGPMIAEAHDKEAELSALRSRWLEEDDWNRLNKSDYIAMRNYLLKYPNTVHKTELDDLMWNCTSRSSKDEVNRYLSDWRPSGRHVAEAETILEGYRAWENLLLLMTSTPKEDVFKVADFIKRYPNHPVIADANQKFQFMRQTIFNEMRTNPGNYKQVDLDNFINGGVFTKQDFVSAGLMPSLPHFGGGEAIELPSLLQFAAHANYEAMSGCTDVYLMGVPGSGKTCLLMGLMGSDGEGYSINFKAKGGPYASALNLYLRAGKIPSTTPGQFVTTIRSTIEEKGKKGEVLNHEINFVEMSGEEFANKIANNDATVSLENMGRGTMHLLRNSNRKVFFLIVDPTQEVFKFKYDEPQYDANNNMVGLEKKEILVDQTACITKFIDLFEMPENKEFMKNVDAIHFIVTKADTLGQTELDRKEHARDHLLKTYKGPIQKLIAYCRRSKRVNYATDFKPKAYPFSLGQFFVGGSFNYNNVSALKTIDTLRHITAAKKEGNFWDDLRDTLA